ncbi:Atp-dependent helicase, partial [Globisporangium splendens]
MEAQARAFEYEIAQLNDRAQDAQTVVEKQRLYGRVGQFLMGSFDGHWWCRFPSLMVFMMRILELYPAADSVRVFYEKMATQLGWCCKCVDIYHASLPSVRIELEYEFTPSSIKAFFYKIAQLDADRLHGVFTLKSLDPSGGVLLGTLAHASRAEKEKFATVTSTALYEILSQRRLYSDFRIVRVISKWLTVAPLDAKEMLNYDLLRNCVGVYQLLVSPDSGVRYEVLKLFTNAIKLLRRCDILTCGHILLINSGWANSLVRKFGAIDLSGENGQDQPFMKVLEEWMYILESESFNTPVLSLDLQTTEELPLFLEPTNCIKTPTNQTLWAALDTIMQVGAHDSLSQMDETSLEVMLESFDNLPDLVFNYLNDAEPTTTNQQITFVVDVVAMCRFASAILFCFDVWGIGFGTILSTHRKCGAKKEQVFEDGALPESQLIDYSVSESAFWWPCGLNSTITAGGSDLEQLWGTHLFNVIVDPKNVPALVDHAAITCSTILSKHLLLARDVVFTCLTRSGDVLTREKVAEMTKSKPIITLLLGKLSTWRAIATIPVTVHGALFESIGGVSEILNVIEAQQNVPEEIVSFKTVLKKYEAHLMSYLASICEEVLVKGLSNPLRFPVVAQHTSLCLLSPTSEVDQSMKRVEECTREANDSIGVISDLGAPQHGGLFARCPLAVAVIATIFELVGTSLLKVLDGTYTSSSSLAGADSANVSLRKLPILVNDFLVAVLSSMYDPKKRIAMVEETILVRVLDFAVTFWVFWTEVMKDPNAATKRSAGLIVPLVRCIETGSAAEKTRAAEVLMIVLETLVRGSVLLDEATLRQVESIRAISSSVQSKRSTDFSRMTKKLRQLDRTSNWFSRKQSTISDWRTSREAEALAQASPSSSSLSSSSRARKDAREIVDVTGSSKAVTSSRPMSAKAAARAQAKMAVDLTGASDTYFDSAARKNHSFYAEPEYSAPRSRQPSPAERDDKPKSSFSISQVVKGLSHAHGGGGNQSSYSRSENRSGGPVVNTAPEEPAEEEEDEALQFAGLFHRIKNTQKPIPVCSLLPFYRQLLQLCMPMLLTREFENERSDKVLPSPDMTFKKSSEYVNAFLPLLLEECNNELQEGLRKCISSGGGHLLRYESEKPREGMRCLNFTIVQVDESATSSFFKNDSRSRGTPKDKVFRNGDVVLMRIAAGANHQQSGFMGNRELLGVIMISETEKGRKRSAPDKKPDAEEEEIVKVLFLNDGELDSVTEEVGSFTVESLSASAIADSEWKVHCLGNLTTAAREYISLRSVDMLPEHLRTTILTPNVYKSTQTELILITTAIDELRSSKSSDADAKVVKLLKRLDKMDVTLMDLRTTSIGKAINKLRKHDNAEVKALSSKLKDKWTSLMNESDALQRAPRFLPQELWDAIKVQYNQSQLQSVHSVLNNYNVGISLLQGPPGTGKTKTIMGLLSGFLALRPPASAIIPSNSFKSTSTAASAAAVAKGESSNKPPRAESTKSGFNNFQLAREIGSTAQPSPSSARPTFSLSAVTSGMGSILRRTDADPNTGPVKKATIQALKNTTTVRSRLEDKLSARKPSPSAPSSLVVRQRVISSNPAARSMGKSCNVLLCAPSNGAVDELVLRIVTDGLMDSTGKVTRVHAPSVHPEALSEDWLSIVRLGNPSEDAPDIVKSVCLPQIIKRELDIHPKALQLRSLQETQQTLRKSIRDFHQKPKDASEGPKSRKGLAQIHAQLTKCSGEVRRLRDEVFAIRTKMTGAILSRASIIACTLSKSGSGPLSGLQRGFDALIIDEAAQAVELSTLVPIRERVARVVLVGDPKQLPATVKSVVAANARYDRSLFERIAESGVAPSMLRVQYRMHPFLREFPSKRFYGGMLTDGPSVMERVQKVCPGVYKFPRFQPFLLYDVTNSSEEDMNGSKYNRIEAQFCIEICQNMFQTCADVRKHNWSVGFVSPYKEQVRVLRREITRSSIPSSTSIEVNTVDGFQGREKDVIIFSCVRASRRGGIGFLKDIRRLNVAITRARFCLFVVGHVDTLVRDETWSALVRSADDRKLVIRTRGSNFADVSKRLESDESKHLVEHFRDMHEKAMKKVAAPAAVSASTEPSDSFASKSPEKTSELPQNVEMKQESSTVAAAADASSTPALAVKDEVESKQPTGEKDIKKEDNAERGMPPSSSNQLPDLPAITPFASATTKSLSDSKSSVVVSEARSSSSSDRHAVHTSSNDSRLERYDSRPSSSGSNHNDRDYDRLKKREYGRDGDRSSHPRDVEDQHRSKRPRHGNERSKYSPRDAHRADHDYQRHQDRRRDERRSHPSTPTATEVSIEPPKSISAKEFCMENEPPPVRKPAVDRGHDTHERRKRPYNDGQHQSLSPPGHKYHAREQQQRISQMSMPPRGGQSSGSTGSSRGGHRSVTVSTTNSANHQRPPISRRTPSPAASSAPSSRPSSASHRSSGGGGGVLGSILGSASRLASATSRVQDSTIDRSREFQ